MIRFTMTNLPAFKQSMQDLQTRVKKAAIESLEISAQAVVQNAKEKAPVKSGRLRDNISIQKKQSDITAITVKVGVSYAGSIEFGTITQPAQPFLFPAFEEERDNIRQTFKGKIKKALGKNQL